MEFEEMIEKIFNYVEKISTSEVAGVRKKTVTPFGTITTYGRRTIIELAKKENKNDNMG